MIMIKKRTEIGPHFDGSNRGDLSASRLVQCRSLGVTKQKRLIITESHMKSALACGRIEHYYLVQKATGLREVS